MLGMKLNTNHMLKEKAMLTHRGSCTKDSCFTATCSQHVNKHLLSKRKSLHSPSLLEREAYNQYQNQRYYVQYWRYYNGKIEKLVNDQKNEATSEYLTSSCILKLI